MKTIAYLTQKGGSGKTTLAVHSAVEAVRDRQRVAIIDTDPQQSATVWSESRESEVPVVATASAQQLETVLTAARHDGMTLCIIDAAPHAAPEASRVAKAADLVLIPVRPTAFDLAAVGKTVDIVRAAGRRAAFVLSACPFRSPEIVEAREVLKGYGLPVCPVDIIERRSFSRAVASGRAVAEFEPDGKAAGEIRDLWKWIKKELYA